MFTICTKNDWLDDNFDLDWCEDYYGTYDSLEEAKAKAKELDANEKWMYLDVD